MRVCQIRILAWALALVIAALLFFCSRRQDTNSPALGERPPATTACSPLALLPSGAPATLLPITDDKPAAKLKSEAPLRVAHVIREPMVCTSEPELTLTKPYRLEGEASPPPNMPALPLDALFKEPPRERAAVGPRVAKDLSTGVAPTSSQPSPLPIMATANPAMQPVHAAARQHVVRGFSLGDKAAVYAARTEFIQALRTIAQAVDAQAGLPPQDPQSCSSALARGLRTLTEVDDFAPSGSRLDANLDLSAIIQAHRTVACKQHQPASQLAALQAYLDYARGELQRAAAASPVASQALTGLGKSYTVATEQNQGRLAAAKAMVFHQAAVTTDARNHLSANELGVLLAQHGQWEPAKQSFLQSLRVEPDAATWQNLSAVHRQLGENELAKLAEQECELIRDRSPNESLPSLDGKPTVQWVDPKAFAGPPEDGLPAPRGDQQRAASALKRSDPKSWFK